MKPLLLKLAAMLGVVPARRYNTLIRATEELRASAQSWKERAGDAMARVKSLEAEIKRQAHLTKESWSALERLHHREGELATLREQLVHTERELMLAREHLMAIEVKLDILEGAANVLDTRTRTAVRGQSTGTGATV